MKDQNPKLPINPENSENLPKKRGKPLGSKDRLPGGRIRSTLVERMEKDYVKRKLTEEEELFNTLANPDKQSLAQKRLNDFVTQFMKTKGNATEAASQAFGILNRAVASNVGGFYLRKAQQYIGRMYLEKQGTTTGDVFETIAMRAKVEKDPEYIRMLARLMGVADIVAPEAGNTNQNVNVNILQDYRKTQDEFGFGDVGEVVEGEEVEEEVKNDKLDQPF